MPWPWGYQQDSMALFLLIPMTTSHSRKLLAGNPCERVILIFGFEPELWYDVSSVFQKWQTP
jgi:hypothetical protein